MKRTTNYQPHSVIREDRPDGSILLRSAMQLGPVLRTTGDWLHRWEQEAADRVFLAERSGVGWRDETYRSTLQKVRALASSLLARGIDAQTPILIMSGNGVDHGLIALAAQYAGIPTVPIAEQYSLIPGAHGRLLEVVELVRPKLAFVDDAECYGAALALGAFADIEVVASRPVGAAATSLDYLLRGDQSVDLTAAHAAVVRPFRLPKWH